MPRTNKEKRLAKKRRQSQSRLNTGRTPDQKPQDQQSDTNNNQYAALADNAHDHTDQSDATTSVAAAQPTESKQSPSSSSSTSTASRPTDLAQLSLSNHVEGTSLSLTPSLPQNEHQKVVAQALSRLRTLTSNDDHTVHYPQQQQQQNSARRQLRQVARVSPLSSTAELSLQPSSRSAAAVSVASLSPSEEQLLFLALVNKGEAIRAKSSQITNKDVEDFEKEIKESFAEHEMIMSDAEARFDKHLKESILPDRSEEDRLRLKIATYQDALIAAHDRKYPQSFKQLQQQMSRSPTSSPRHSSLHHAHHDNSKPKKTRPRRSHELANAFGAMLGIFAFWGFINKLGIPEEPIHKFLRLFTYVVGSVIVGLAGAGIIQRILDWCRGSEKKQMKLSVSAEDAYVAIHRGLEPPVSSYARRSPTTASASASSSRSGMGRAQPATVSSSHTLLSSTHFGASMASAAMAARTAAATASEGDRNSINNLP